MSSLRPRQSPTRASRAARTERIRVRTEPSSTGWPPAAVSLRREGRIGSPLDEDYVAARRRQPMAAEAPAGRRDNQDVRAGRELMADSLSSTKNGLPACPG